MNNANINNGLKEPSCGHQNCNISQILICGGVSQDERIFAYRRMNTMLNHIDTRVILHRYEGSFMVYIYTHLYDIGSKNVVKYPYSIGITKSEILILDAEMISS